MGRKHKFESKALQFTYERYAGKNPKRQADFEKALAGAEIARQIYDLRTKAGLTQAKLAELAGTTTSGISRLEDADYDRHSLAALRRIAAALNRRVQVSFVPLRSRAVLTRAAKRMQSRRVTAALSSRKKST